MQEQAKKGISLNVAALLIRGWAATIYPFMRRGIGKHHPGMLGVFGLAWLVLWVAYTHASGLLWIVPLYLLGQLSHSLGHARKTSHVHTDYGGEPLLAMKLLRFKDEAAAKRFGEPLISFALGLGLLWYGFPEGKYFAFGAIALAMNQAIIDRYNNRRVDDLRDGMIESRHLMGQLRQRR